MKHLLILVSLLTLSGCWATIDQQEINHFVEGCKDFGGIDTLYVHQDHDHHDYAKCVEGNVQINAKD
ncbi:hypothetical protein [Vibrio phage VCPH]|nr:hypothetical protein [Vibrio phage VCPH]